MPASWLTWPTGPAWLACGLAAMAAVLAVPTGAESLLWQRLSSVEESARRDGVVARLRQWIARRSPRVVVPLGIAGGGCGLVVLARWIGPAAVGAGFVVAGGVLVGWWLRRAGAGRRARLARRRAVVELCDVMTGELLAGRQPRAALIAAADEAAELTTLLAPAVTAARLEGEVAAALRRAATPGVEGLSLLAAAWEVAERSGSGLADILDRLGQALRDEEEVHREVVAQLATPRTTARLLAVLPLFGLLLGSTTGANPMLILFTTPYGLACLVLGGGLAALGLWWVERLARTAEEAR